MNTCENSHFMFRNLSEAKIYAYKNQLLMCCLQWGKIRQCQCPTAEAQSNKLQYFHTMKLYVISESMKNLQNEKDVQSILSIKLMKEHMEYHKRPLDGLMVVILEW